MAGKTLLGTLEAFTIVIFIGKLLLVIALAWLEFFFPAVEKQATSGSRTIYTCGGHIFSCSETEVSHPETMGEIRNIKAVVLSLHYSC